MLVPYCLVSCLISFLWFQIGYSYYVSHRPIINTKRSHPVRYQSIPLLLYEHKEATDHNTVQQNEQQEQASFTSSSRSHTFTPPPIIACSSNIEVERAISMYIRPNDTILELGSHLSQVSTHLCQTIGHHGKAILVDVQRSDAKSGRTLHRAVDDFVPSQDHPPTFYWSSYIQLQHFHQWRSALYNTTNRQPMVFDAMILDVAASIGNDLYMTALATAEEFMYQQQSLWNSPRVRVIIIKSRNLSSLARRLVHAQRLFDQTVHLPLNLSRSDEPCIIASVGVEEYRRTIPFVVRVGDSCIEVGCHFGRTTLALYNAAVQDSIHSGGSVCSGRGFCIGVDIGPKIIDHAKKELPHIPFAVADAWRVMDLIRLRQRFLKNTTDSDLGYDVIYADIGGMSGPDGLLESLALIDALGRGIEPRTIVVKSLCLNRLASRLKALTNEWQKRKVVLNDGS
jgi:hypothetical protein